MQSYRNIVKQCTWSWISSREYIPCIAYLPSVEKVFVFVKASTALVLRGHLKPTTVIAASQWAGYKNIVRYIGSTPLSRVYMQLHFYTEPLRYIEMLVATEHL
jgi:hypothetical protein